ncbi:MAG: hypothetical protein ACW98F_07085 [Candidatus Hodarchaeales archaeon]|jgi:hypothetical protein
MSGKEVIVAIIGAVIITSGLSVVVFPYVYPNVKTDRSVILQSLYQETDASASTYDHFTTYLDVPETYINITLEENSKIRAEFSTPYVLGIRQEFTAGSHLYFNVSLNIIGVGKRETIIKYYEDVALSSWREIGASLYIVYQTDELPAGTYEIKVRWVSRTDVPGDNYLTFSLLPNHRRLRALTVQEIAG